MKTKRTTQAIGRVSLVMAALLLAPQASQAEISELLQNNGLRNNYRLRIRSVHAAFDGSYIQPKIAREAVAFNCNGKPVCREEIKARDFGAKGKLTSLSVFYSCRAGSDEFYAFKIDNESKLNHGSHLNLNCYRSVQSASQPLGGALDLMASFAVSVSSHLTGSALDQLLFPSGIDQQSLADAIKIVVKQALDEQTLEGHQNDLNGQLLTLSQLDTDVRDAVGQSYWDSTVANVKASITSDFVNTIQQTEQGLRTDSQKNDVRGTAFPSYISSASALLGLFEFQQELENYTAEPTGNAPDPNNVVSLKDRLGNPDKTPIIPFVLETKADMIYDDLAANRPICYRLTDTNWGFKDCDGKLYKAANNAKEWDYDACYVNTWSPYMRCAEQAYAVDTAQNAMGWIDDTVQGWRQALVDSQAQLPVTQLPCDFCSDAFNTITVNAFLLGWQTKNGNSSPSATPTVLAEARCNNLNKCDAYYPNGDLPGYTPGEDNANNKTHISSAAVQYHCAGDAPGTYRVFKAVAGVDFDSKGINIHLDCSVPAS